MPPASPHAVLLAAESQWVFTLDDLQRTPSGLDGMPLDQERENRGKGVNFITQVGIMLKLPQLTLATAAVFLHRFFMRHSMVDKPGKPGYHYYATAATCLFLSTKVEENCRKMRELIIACARVAQKNPALVIDEQSKEYWRWRDTILHNEDVLLETLCFDLTLEAPYKTLYNYLHRFGEQDNRALRNAGWAFLNDSQTTMLSVLYPSRTIAAAALYCSAKHVDAAFADTPDGRAWWEVLGVSLPGIRGACNYMASIYQHAPPRSQQGEHANMYSFTPEDGDPTTAKTRLRRSPLPPDASPNPSFTSEAPSQTHLAPSSFSANGAYIPSSPRKRSREPEDDHVDVTENDSRARPPRTHEDSLPLQPKRTKLASPSRGEATNGDINLNPSHHPPSPPPPPPAEETKPLNDADEGEEGELSEEGELES
ncbi:MAG: hypothetical protein M1833_006415 [Piccolia ochrophora]|nr:MAG: hypothetical protein M1833_006415 [Piccolia ochrophora]